jgi:hypothetical protein
MARKVLINLLELAYAPVCNYDFSRIKEDVMFQEFVKKSTIYILTQRKELTFEKLILEFEPPNQTIICFEIRQKGNLAVLKCKLPVYQTNLATDSSQEISFHMEYGLPVPEPLPRTFPQDNIRNLLLFYHNGPFITWLSPENFIQNYLNGAIDAVVEGPVETFIKYKVHYVGKATEQDVWKRLTGHATLQEILGNEYPLHMGSLPTHEIAILFFKLKDAIGLHTIGVGDPIMDDVISSAKGTPLAPEKAVSLDAEKALINAMRPKYNKQFYKNYPVSTDGLSPFGLNGYCFQVHSHIILQYDNGEIWGRPGFTADSIIVKEGEPLQVINEGKLN